MKKISLIAGLLLLAAPALAAVTVTTAPVSLVTSPLSLGASSAATGVFSFGLGADAGETLSSVAVTVNNAALSTATSSDLASVSVYRDSNSNGTLEIGTDLVAGTQGSVNVGSATTVTTSANNALPGTFFVALTTGASWSGVVPADSVTVTLGADGIVTSASSPTVTAVTTSAITATAPVVVDTTGPVLMAAVKQNSGAGSVALTFGEATNKPAITAGNIAAVLTLSGSHSWLDGASAISSATWSADGKVLTVTLSNTTSNPTIAVGDTVTVAGSVIKDAAGNNATGAATITQATSNDDEGEDGDSEEGEGHPCANTLINGRLYKVVSPTVYLAANCRLKPFRGAAVFHARGNKFQNILVLSSLTGFEVSTQPALPAAGTLIKGSDKTVWFVETGHKRKGFASAEAFLGLGFKFSQVHQITDDDLNTMAVDTQAVTDATVHPSGSLIKCGNSATVFTVIGNTRFPYTNVAAFELRGHSFEHIAVIDCGRFNYVLGQEVAQ